MKKLLAFTAGRRNSNTDMFVKTVLREAKNDGINVEMIRLNDCNIQPCKACTKMICMVKGPKACIHKDDAGWLYDKYLECDGFLLAAPVWDLSPCGIITVLRDRIWGPRAARSSWTTSGGVPDWAKEAENKKPCALISVGGALTENWTSLGIATLYTCMFPEAVRVIDHMNVYGVADPGEALMRKDYMRRAKNMGQNLAHAIHYPDSGWKNEFWGSTEQEEACPGCHQSLLIARPGKKTVECAICGRTGKIRMDEDGMKFEWPFDPNDRLTDIGVLKHLQEINYHTEEIYQPQFDSIKEEYDALKKDESFVVKPER